MIDPKIIRCLHTIYCQETGFALALTFSREYAWSAWLHHRPSEPFTEDDLRTVIWWIKWEIKQDRRWDASLKFHNLVENAERFEEDLSCARSAERVRAKVKAQAVDPAKVAVLKRTGREAEADGMQVKTTAQIFNENKLLKSLLKDQGL